VQLNRKTALLTPLLLVAALAGGGCSGINASKDVSPATFLIPGFFGQTSPAPAAPSSPAEPAILAEPAQAFAPAN